MNERHLVVKGCGGRAMGMSIRNDMTTGRNQISAGNSPVPYLLAGVGVMLVLIAFALIVLTWSYLKERTPEGQENNRSVLGDGRKNERTKDVSYNSDAQDDLRIIVIMAGDEKPTFIAKPAPVAAISY